MFVRRNVLYVASASAVHGDRSLEYKKIHVHMYMHVIIIQQPIQSGLPDHPNKRQRRGRERLYGSIQLPVVQLMAQLLNVRELKGGNSNPYILRTCAAGRVVVVGLQL